MNVLAIETSTIACSVALRSDDDTYLRHELKPREHTKILLPMIRELLQTAAIDSQDLDAVVLGNGPGSFIGMRIGASVAQGLAFAANAALVPVSSLATVAQAALPAANGAAVLVAQDAHMNEVYLAGYSQSDDGRLVEVLPPRLQPAARFACDLQRPLAAGAGWDRYPALYDANADWLAGRAAELYPSAADLLLLGIEAWQAGQTVAPERLEPAYLREQVATPPA